MQVPCKYYANFIVIALLCGLMTINKTAWGQIYDMEYPDHLKTACGFNRQKVFVLPPIPTLEQRIDSSSFVFEGVVIRSWELPYNDRIYRCHTVAVKKIFKGDFVADTVEVLSYYGRNPNDKRPQYIGEISESGGQRIFFVVPINITDLSKNSNRPRFKSAVINGSAECTTDICCKLKRFDDCGKCYKQNQYKKVYEVLKKHTKKCMIMDAKSKKKVKF